MNAPFRHIAILSACAHRLYLYRPELFDALHRAGFSVTVFGPESLEEGQAGLGPAGIEYRELGLARRGIDPFAERRALDLIVRLGREQGFGVIYSYGIRFAPLANNAARALGVPCMNVINGAGSLFITGGPVGTLRRLLIFPYIRTSLRYASRVVFQNEDDRGEFLRRRLVKDTQCILVPGSGVNLERFPVYDLPEQPVFGFCSRLNPEKGIYELLRAFEQVVSVCPEARLRLAGELDGIEKTETYALLRRLCDAGSAEYLGEISDVPSFLRTVRCFVFPSYREGTPRAVLEAMSCGRPVITTDVTGCRETVKNGYNGILVPAREVIPLRDAMLRFCRGEADADGMGKASRRYAEEHFDVHAVNRVLTGQIQKLYRPTAAAGRQEIDGGR